jgi:hypothetical protein
MDEERPQIVEVKGEVKVTDSAVAELATNETDAVTNLNKERNATLKTAEDIRRNTQIVLIACLVVIVGIAVVGVILRPERTLEIFAFSGTVLASLIAIIKGQSEVHKAVNSQMDKNLEIVAELATLRATVKGIATGRALQKGEDSGK